MLRKRCREIAESAGLGKISFVSKTCLSSGRVFNAGYVTNSIGRRELFCKTNSWQLECFYLCNEFEQLSPEESKESRSTY
jgi:hypothetical protein